MSLFESVGKKLLGSLLGGQSGAGADAGGSLVDNIMQMVNEAGGIQAVLQKFQEAGFGQQVASWLGQGSNLPISGDQTQQALGGLLSHLSQRTGLSESMLAEGVAKLLPGVVDKLSPSGEVADSEALPGQLQEVLKGGISKLFG